MDSSLITKEFKQFVQRYWFLTSLKSQNQPNESDLKSIKRSRWYCNLTGRSIPHLQKFNTRTNFDVTIKEDSEDYDDHFSNEEKACASELLYNGGYDSYHIFECGHCYIDIHVIAALFDYIESRHMPMIKLKKMGEKAVDDHVNEQLNSFFSKCFVCGGNRCHDDRLSLYACSTILNTGTVFLPSRIIDKKNFGDICDELKWGDVIDSEGYRGTGLYIYEGNRSYSKVPCDEYYPNWPLEYLKTRGYLYYLTSDFETLFDRLPFDNKIWAYYDFENDHLIFKDSLESDSFTENTDQLIFKDLVESESLESDEMDVLITDLEANKVMISSHDYHLTLEKMAGEDYFSMPYPFANSKQANLLLCSGLNLKTKLTESEYLLFRNKVTYISGQPGSPEFQIPQI